MIRSRGAWTTFGVWCLLSAVAGVAAAAQDNKPADKPTAKPPAAATPAPDAAPADDATKPAPKAPAPGSAPAGEDQFSKVFADWKELLTKLRTLQVDYRIAKPEEQADIEKQYNQLVAQGVKMEPEVRRSAEAAFKANPKNKQVTDFLEAQARKAYDKDNADEGLRTAELLLKGGYTDPRLYNIAGVSAFNANQYDLAKKYLDEAKQRGVLDEHGAQDLVELPKTKERWEKEAEIRKKEATENLPRVKLETTKGPIVVELFENEAPNSTANFISLVEKGFYDGTPFHRVLEHFMAQGGDPTGTGTGGPGYAIKCECYQPNARMHFRGTLSMAHAAERDTGGSQFFLTFVPTNHLNGKHTAFGRVVEGMEVLTKLNRIDPDMPSGAAPDKIVKATVVRKRDHAYEPKTIPDPRGS